MLTPRSGKSTRGVIVGRSHRAGGKTNAIRDQREVSSNHGDREKR
jgi:hypothetical protein